MHDIRTQNLWNALHAKLLARRNPAPTATDESSDVVIGPEGSSLPLVGSDSYPSLDLMRNWTSERPSIAQILESSSTQQLTESVRQSGDLVDPWRFTNGIN